jgi:protein-serine/threonine kinase
MKLIDFELAKLLSTRSLNNKYSFVGTPAYMAPEMHTQSRANALKADIYALGIVLYQMFYNGVLLFE